MSSSLLFGLQDEFSLAGERASTCSASFPTTTRRRAGSRARAERRTCPSIGTPHSSCSTFARLDFIRVPWPAARTMTVVSLNLNLLRPVSIRPNRPNPLDSLGRRLGECPCGPRRRGGFRPSRYRHGPSRSCPCNPPAVAARIRWNLPFLGACEPRVLRMTRSGPRSRVPTLIEKSLFRCIPCGAPERPSREIGIAVPRSVRQGPPPLPSAVRRPPRPASERILSDPSDRSTVPPRRQSSRSRSPNIQVHGNTTGLKSSQVKALERLGRRRLSDDRIVTNDLARELTTVSNDVRRQVGVLLDRSAACSTS